MDCSMPGLPVHQLPEFTQTHVRWVSDAINNLILCCPFLLPPSIFLSIRVFPMSHLFASGGQSIHYALGLKYMGFPGGTVVKNPPANAGNARRTSLIPGLGRFSGVGNGNPLQYSCLKNSIEKEVCRLWPMGCRVRHDWVTMHAHTTHDKSRKWLDNEADRKTWCWRMAVPWITNMRKGLTDS